ncbi:MAG: hypothetical protein GY793_01555 [Proteobacteria bacterium]|nr:hypothetical protein [Pseudomonadota bacterium]
MNKETENLKETDKCNIDSVRESALKWFNSISLEQQFYATIECNELITGDRTRHPSTLTGLEIEKIYTHLHSL